MEDTPMDEKKLMRSKNCFQMKIAALPILIQRRCIKYPEVWDVVEDKYQYFVSYLIAYFCFVSSRLCVCVIHRFSVCFGF
jgi:hypothetical protein